MINNYFSGMGWSKKDIRYLLEAHEEYENYSTLNCFLRRYSIDSVSYTHDEILQKIPYDISFYWESAGVNLIHSYNTIAMDRKIRLALSYIKEIDENSLYVSVKLLVKSIHLIKPDKSEYDISYSDPEFPFTIFINIPNSDHKFWLERTVENIIHETMHLQLSLLENKYNLYSNVSKKIFSPWKGEERNPQGVLHALYVFSNLKLFWSKVYQIKKCSFAKKRVQEISKEIKMVDYDSLIPLYTDAGNLFIQKCFSL